MKTAENLLNAAIGILRERGRCRESFVLGEAVDPLGALAVAAGLKPDAWLGLRHLPEAQICGVDRVLVDAAWGLARVVAPVVAADCLAVNRLVGLLGDWSDAASDDEVFDALAKAAAQTSSTHQAGGEPRE